MHHTRWYCRGNTHILYHMKCSIIIDIKHIFLHVYIISYARSRLQTFVLARFLKKCSALTHHYYNIFMGNPLTSSKGFIHLIT